MKNPSTEDGELSEVVDRLRVKWQEIPVEDINIEDTTYQYRVDPAVADLVSSLQAEGQLEPIDLMWRRPHTIIDGFRRIKAAKSLGWESIKAFVHSEIAEDEAFRIAFTKNVVRKNLIPLEKANAMYLALQRGMQRRELGTAFDISEKQVKRYLALLSFSKAIQRILDGKKVTMAHASLLSQFKVRDEDVPTWTARITNEKLTARQLKSALSNAIGKGACGRKRLYVSIKNGHVRCYPCRLGKNSSNEEIAKFIKQCRRAITVLESILAGQPS